jgi:hypothetical protein
MNPSSQPTSSPSCGVGSGLAEGAEYWGAPCEECPAGTYRDDVNNLFCKNCDVGTYSDSSGTVSCSSCPFLLTNLNNGSQDCPNYCICMITEIVIPLFTALVLLFIVTLYPAGDLKWQAFGVMVFPALVRKEK